MSGARTAGSLSLGIDIGGTFTDAVLRDSSGVLAQIKTPTTVRDPGIGFVDAVRRLQTTSGLSDESLGLLVHATTVATNAVIEGRTAKVGLVVTRGFRDVLEIARQIRPDLFDLHRQKPAPLVPRDLVLEVDERIGPRGEQIRALEAQEIERIVSKVRTMEIDGLVVSLLHSHADSRHERAVGEAIQRACPGLDVSLSSEVWPEFREYFRTSTAIVNAAVRPIVTRYLKTIIDSLSDFDLRRRFYVMQSSGGMMSASTASLLPVHLIESGPAAGLVGASHLGRAKGWRNLISLDIGGTTAKVGLIVDGRPRITHEYEVGAIAASMGGRSKASGYPIRTPVLDLVEIGAGGGSIAWVDSGGALRVGPRSAGAEPGPACYGQGGTLPTVTDANLVLGRIDPDFFLGGEIALDRGAAERAIRDVCADPLGIETTAAAAGIISIANASMVRALRLVSVQRGYDPREFVLIAFGGAGPLHANALAIELGIPAVVIPPNPGVFSANGLLLAEVQHVVTSTALTRLDSLTEAAVRTRFETLGAEATFALEEQGVARHGVELRRYADMRFRGQSYELPIPVDWSAVQVLEQLRESFLQEHNRQYGHASRDGTIEIVNWKVYAVAAAQASDGSAPSRSNGAAAMVTPRTTQGQAHDGKRQAFRRGEMPIGAPVQGPAIVADADATTFVEDGWTAVRDESDILLLTPRTSD
jgi:N-methylhydantoinase A